MNNTALIKELRSHYIAVLAYSLGDHNPEVTKADAASSEIDAIKAFIDFLEAQADAVVAVVTKAVRKGCAFHRTICRTFGIAKEHGLDTRDDAGMRAAIGRYLGRDVPTREVLRERDWLLIGNAIKYKQLAW